MTYCGWGGRPSMSILVSSRLRGSSVAIEDDRPDSDTKLLACVYEGQVVDKLHLLYCGIITRTSTLPTCMTYTHTWEQWTRCSESRSERTISDESITGCEIVVSLQLAFILLNATCHVQAMYTYVWPWHMVQSESDMIEYVSPSWLTIWNVQTE